MGIRVYSSKSRREGPTKLIVGGLHGREGASVGPVLRRLTLEGGPRSGTVVVVPSLCDGGRYVSTLSDKYLSTAGGRRLVRLLRAYGPDVYVEVHCYARRAYKSLTSPLRMLRRGAPPFVELEEGVLIGSPSPKIASLGLFKHGIAFEVPCGAGARSEVLLRLLRVVRDGESVEGIFERMAELYPRQMARAAELFSQYGEALGR